MNYTNFLAPPDKDCAICGTPLLWCIGGMRCLHEHNDERHKDCCIVCGEWEEDCSCKNE